MLVVCCLLVPAAAALFNMTKKSWFLFLILSCVVGLIIRLNIILQSPEDILARYGSDDLFYYAEVAKNIVSGGGITFDGIHPTTGVQPLWVVAQLSFANWFEEPAIALRVILLLATLFSLLTALLLPKVLSQILPKHGWAIGAVAGSIWVLHPKILQVTFEGTEAALAGFAWLLSLAAWKAAQKSSKYYLLGVVLGIGILTRIDHLVLAGMLWLFPIQNIKGFTKKAVQMIPGIVLLFGAGLFLGWLTTGELGMDSGRVKRLHYLRLLALENNVLFSEVSSFSLLAEQATGWLKNGSRYLSYMLHAESKVSLTLITILLAGLSWLVYKITRRGRTIRQELEGTFELVKVLKPLLFASSLIFVAYIVYLHYLRSWYLIPLFFCFALLISALFYDLLLRATAVHRKKNAFAMVFFFSCLSLLHIEAKLAPRRGVDANFFAAINYVQEELPEGSTIGAFNSGIAGAWLSPKHTVVNLDGVINHSAVDALENFGLYDYLKEEGIDYLFDYQSSVAFYHKIGGGSVLENIHLEKQYLLYGEDSLRLGLWQINFKPDER